MDPFDQIFRSHDCTSESVGKDSGHLRQSSERKKKRGDGWVGEGKNQGGVGGEGQKKVWRMGDDVIEKNIKLKLKN